MRAGMAGIVVFAAFESPQCLLIPGCSSGPELKHNKHAGTPSDACLRAWLKRFRSQGEI
jgi:hypothetical protein